MTDFCISAGSICNKSAQFGALRTIAAPSRVQPVTIQRNSARCVGLVHFCGINLQQFGTIRRAATDCSTIAGSICNNSVHFGADRRIGALRLDQSVTIRRNSARCDGLQHFRGINLQQFGAIRRADGLQNFRGINLQQFGTIRRSATDCCTFTGSICNNSAQFGALRRIGALLRDQSVTIWCNSARCDGLQHFRGTNL